MLTISVWPRRLKEFLLTHPLYKSPRRGSDSVCKNSNRYVPAPARGSSSHPFRIEAEDCCRQTAARTSGYTLPHTCYFTMTWKPFVYGDSYGPRSIRPMTRGLPARSVGTVIPFALPAPTHGEPLKSV